MGYTAEVVNERNGFIYFEVRCGARLYFANYDSWSDRLFIRGKRGREISEDSAHGTKILQACDAVRELKKSSAAKPRSLLKSCDWFPD